MARYLEYKNTNLQLTNVKLRGLMKKVTATNRVSRQREDQLREHIAKLNVKKNQPKE